MLPPVIFLHTGLPVRSPPVPCILPRVNVQRTDYSQPFIQESVCATLHGTYRRSGTVMRLPVCGFLTCFHVALSGLQEALIRRACWRLGWRINCRSRLKEVQAVKCWSPAPSHPDLCSVCGAGIHGPRQPSTVTYPTYPTVPSRTSTRVSRSRRHQVTVLVLHSLPWSYPRCLQVSDIGDTRAPTIRR